jgi:hypothetical protein
MNEELEKRIEAAVQDAEFEFWAEIAKKFPEAKTGDLDPFTVCKMNLANVDMVKQWVSNNTDLIPDEEEKEEKVI